MPATMRLHILLSLRKHTIMFLFLLNKHFSVHIIRSININVYVININYYALSVFNSIFNLVMYEW